MDEYQPKGKFQNWKKNPKMEISELLNYLDGDFKKFRGLFFRCNIKKLAYVKYRMKFRESDELVFEIVRYSILKKIVTNKKMLKVCYLAVIELVLSIDLFTLPDTKQTGRSTKLSKNPIAKTLYNINEDLNKLFEKIDPFSDSNNMIFIDARIPSNVVSELKTIRQSVNRIDSEYRNVCAWDESWNYKKAVDRMTALNLSPPQILKILNKIYAQIKNKKRREFYECSRTPEEIIKLRIERKKLSKNDRKDVGINYYFRVQPKTIIEYLFKKTGYFKHRGRKKRIHKFNSIH